MKFELTKFVPIKSIIYFLLCLLTFMLFVGFFNFLTQKEIVALETEKQKLEYQLYAHSLFSPFFNEIQKRLSAFEQFRQLQIEPQALPQHQTSKVPTVVNNIAEKSGLSVQSVTLDPQSFQGDGSSVMIKVKLSGNTSAFRHFLREINKLTYVQHLEQIKLSSSTDYPEYEVNLWLKLTT